MSLLFCENIQHLFKDSKDRIWAVGQGIFISIDGKKFSSVTEQSNINFSEIFSNTKLISKPHTVFRSSRGFRLYKASVNVTIFGLPKIIGFVPESKLWRT